jgi:hypothetical protein
MTILISGYCKSCGQYWEFNSNTINPPANVYMNFNKDGTYKMEFLCANAQLCGGRHAKA